MFEDLKRESYEANMQLARSGLIALTFGNVSVIDRDAGLLAIKPSGVDYEKLRVEDMVLVDLEGRTVDGALKPSSDTPTHVRLYQAFEGIRGVVHSHSRYATAFAQAGRPIECYGTTHADYFYGAAPLTRKMTRDEIASRYELETGNVIVERFEGVNPLDFPGVLVQCHGPFAWGPSGAKAVENALALELIAEMAHQSLSLNPALTPLDQALLDKHFLRKHGANAYYGQS
ncbi:L-ribulose-5-phosphate 4-epimerase [Candidatus Sumerlaeota bacterium]|nr:L-ribulose-5-phosphate 4-epimerase [Candidatus Sumerlaeota bacterium]